MTRTFASRIAALTVVAAVALTGCSTTPAREDRPTIVPAQPAVAPEPATAPAGVVAPAAAGEGLAFDAKNRRLAAISGTEIVQYTVDGGLKEVGRSSMPARPSQVVANPDGGFLVAAGKQVVELPGSDGTVGRATYDVDGDVLTVAPYREEGLSVLAGTSDGRIVALGASSNPKTITGPVEASKILVHDGDVAVVDRLQSSVSAVDVAGGKLGKGLRVGRGITNAAVDPYGRLFAVDTGKNQVIGYTIEPLMQRFLYPEKGSPWAVDYDDTDKLMWVTRTATNEVVGYSLNTGIPEQRKLYPTVRQPNALAVDAKTGTLYVQSATGAGIQAIPTR
ncbi:YncE family protein [Tsukamurella sp. DT100]|uniref:YncE family protein n=2 Tax=unclassified Tsukamurella TaxID=2633480 RepID=UPI003CE9544F